MHHRTRRCCTTDSRPDSLSWPPWVNTHHVEQIRHRVESVRLLTSVEEQQRQWENACRGIVPDNPSLGMQIPSVHDPSMAPPGMHAASAYAFPVETPRDQHGHLKNEMADRVVDKISRYAPNF